MKVLYLTHGHSVHDQRFLRAIAAHGHSACLCSLAGAPPRAWTPAGVEVFTLADSPIRQHPSAMPPLIAAFRALLAELLPDVLHAGPVALGGYLAALAQFRPTLVMSWGSDILVDAVADGAWRQATACALAHADAFFCDCDVVRRKAAEIFAHPADRVVQIPWGIDLDVFSPAGQLAPLRFAGDNVILLSTRSWEPLYGIPVLLEAFHRAYQRDHLLRLVLVGDGSLRSEVHEFIRARGLADVIECPGVVPHALLPRYFRAADLYISASLSDGTSVSLLEAMASALPVIVTDLAANREWVTAGRNGWLATPESAEALCSAMLEAAACPAVESREIGRRNRLQAERRANWSANFAAVIETYERLVKTSRA